MKQILVMGILFVMGASVELWADSKEEIHLKVTVVRADNLLDKDWGIFLKKPDSYVEVYFRANNKSEYKFIGKTDTCKNEDNPVWNDTFWATVKENAKGAKLRFVLKDSDWLTKDDKCGAIEISAKAQKEPYKKSFLNAKQACLTVDVKAPNQGKWILTVVEGKNLRDDDVGIHDKDKDREASAIMIGYRDMPMVIVVGKPPVPKEFSYIGKIDDIGKEDHKWNKRFFAEGPKTGTFAFLVCEKRPNPKDFEKAAMLPAKEGKHQVKLTDTKRAYLEVTLKYRED